MSRPEGNLLAIAQGLARLPASALCARPANDNGELAVERVRRIVRRLDAEIRRRRRLAGATGLNDHLLRDIGLARDTLAGVLRKVKGQDCDGAR